MTDTTMTNGIAAGFDVPFVHTRDVGATWHGLIGAPAGRSGKPSAGLPQQFRTAGAHAGQSLRGLARVSGLPGLSTKADEGTRVPESGGTVRERGKRSIDLVEATPRYGAPGQCPRRNSGPTE